jgi:phage gp16-like protein
MGQAQRASTGKDRRQTLIRLVHVAARDLGLDSDTYRACLAEVTGGKASAGEMSAVELSKVLDHFKSKGFQVRHKKATRALDTSPQASKIRALWLLLHRLGAVRNPSEAALAAYVKRIAGVDALQWAADAKLQRLVETMKKWAMRFLPQQVEALIGQVRSLADLAADEDVAIQTTVGKALRAQTFDPMERAYDVLAGVLAKRQGGGA